MRVTTLSKRAFENLEPLALSREVLNTESVILKYSDRGKPKIIKRLFYQDGEIFANKLYTLEMLSTNSRNLPNSFLIPDSLISVSGKIQGFSIPYMERINFQTFLTDEKNPLEEKKYFLYKVGEILNQMKAIRNHTRLNDLFLCDLHASNFIVNPDNKEMGVIDLDSCKIQGNKSSYSMFLNEFALLNNVKGKYRIVTDGSEKGYVTADENSDLYCYNMMLLSFLYGSTYINSLPLETYYSYLNYLKDIGINKELIDGFSDLVSNKPNENPFYIVPTLTKEQVCRAKCIVYKNVMKNKNR